MRSQHAGTRKTKRGVCQARFNLFFSELEVHIEKWERPYFKISIGFQKKIYEDLFSLSPVVASISFQPQQFSFCNRRFAFRGL